MKGLWRTFQSMIMKNLLGRWKNSDKGNGLINRQDKLISISTIMTGIITCYCLWILG